uniref:Sigma-70 family RNA polymerase sigma factor n=1 Tax=Anaerolinea thermolimosa TaxID=229919 RepID=A0A7C4KJP3_9CHLR
MYTTLWLSKGNEIHQTMDVDSLLARARDLDHQALAAIHEMYYPAIYRYVHYRLDDEELVEDIAADVFMCLLDNLQDGRHTIRDVRAWLFGTASHLVNDALRRKYRKPVENLEDHEHLSSNVTPEHAAELLEQAWAVKRAMRLLTPEQQQVLALRFSMEFSLEETAQVMKKSVGAIKTLQFRALGALRRHLTRGDEE